MLCIIFLLLCNKQQKFSFWKSYSCIISRLSWARSPRIDHPAPHPEFHQTEVGVSVWLQSHVRLRILFKTTWLLAAFSLLPYWINLLNCDLSSGGHSASIGHLWVLAVCFFNTNRRISVVSNLSSLFYLWPLDFLSKRSSYSVNPSKVNLLFD